MKKVIVIATQEELVLFGVNPTVKTDEIYDCCEYDYNTVCLDVPDGAGFLPINLVKEVE